MRAWPFDPNWREEVVETYRFLTEVITSESGKEQRRAQRIDPRQSLALTASGFPARFQQLRAELARVGDELIVPSPRLSNALASAASGTTIALLAARWWAKPGRYVVLDDGQVRAAFLLAGVAGTTLTTSTSLGRTWPAGTKVMPGYRSYWSDRSSYQAMTDRVAEITAGFDVSPGFEIVDYGSAGVTFAGREVLVHRHNWTERLQIESSIPREWIDNDSGPRTPWRSIGFQTDVIRERHLIRNVEDLNLTLGLFLRSRGRQGEFWAPSRLNDITLRSGISSGADLWYVDGHEFANIYTDHPILGAFNVRLVDGQNHRFRIESITASMIGGQPVSIIQTVESATSAIALDEITRVSWMPLCRFASDDLRVTWLTSEVAQLDLSYQTLEYVE